MKLLVIPDIHVQHEKAQRIIDKEKADQIALLGDYFDDCGDTPEANRQTAKWLKGCLADARFKCGLGNHDYSYWMGGNARCSGWTVAKHIAIRVELGHEDFAKLFVTLKHDEGNWLLSHAGVDKRWVSEEGLLDEKSPIWSRPDMGGNGKVLRLRETWFQPDLLGPNQLFGHTIHNTPLVIVEGDKQFVDIDTGLNHYAVIDDGALIIKEAKNG